MAEASVSIYEDVNPLVWSPTAWVMEGYLRSWQMDFPDGSNDLVERFLELVYSKIHDKLAKELLELKVISFRLFVKLQLCTVDDMFIHMSLSHRRMVIVDVSDIEEVLHTAFPQLQHHLMKWVCIGWLVGNIKYLWLDIG